MTAPTTGQPLLTPDSAWRQWKSAVASRVALTEREEADPHKDGHGRDTDTATRNEHQARAVWLTTMLEHFGRRVEAHSEAGHDVTSDKALRSLGLPCADCLMVADEKDRGHKIVRDPSKLFTVWASCGAEAADPRLVPMPQW